MASFSKSDVKYLTGILDRFRQFKDSGFQRYPSADGPAVQTAHPGIALDHLSHTASRLAPYLANTPVGENALVDEMQRVYMEVLDGYSTLTPRATEARESPEKHPSDYALSHIVNLLPRIAVYGFHRGFEKKLVAAFETHYEALKKYEETRKPDFSKAQYHLHALAAALEDSSDAGAKIQAQVLNQLNTGTREEKLRQNLSFASFLGDRFHKNPDLHKKVLANARLALEGIKGYEGAKKAYSIIDGQLYGDNRPFRSYPGRSWPEYIGAAARATFGRGSTRLPDHMRALYALRELAFEKMGGRPNTSAVKIAAPAKAHG